MLLTAPVRADSLTGYADRVESLVKLTESITIDLVRMAGLPFIASPAQPSRCLTETVEVHPSDRGSRGI